MSDQVGNPDCWFSHAKTQSLRIQDIFWHFNHERLNGAILCRAVKHDVRVRTLYIYAETDPLIILVVLNRDRCNLLYWTTESVEEFLYLYRNG